MARKKKPLRSLSAIRKAAKKEVAAAMADCQIVVTGDKPTDSELYKRGYDAAVAEMVERSKAIAKQVSERHGRALTDEIMSHLEGVARNFRTSVTKQSEVPNMPKTNRGDVLMLPQGTRLFATGHAAGQGEQRRAGWGYDSVGVTEGIILIEEDPQLRTILVLKSRYRISLPYVTFAINYIEHPNHDLQFSRVYVAFRKEPLKRIDDGGFYYAALPNCNNFGDCNDFGVCMTLDTNNYDNVADLGKAVIDTFWQSIFGYDDEPVPKPFLASPKGKEMTIDSFQKWESLTRSDPTSILTASFRGGSFQLKAMVDRFASRGASHIVTRAIGDIMPISDSKNVQKLIESAVSETISEQLKGGFTNSPTRSNILVTQSRVVPKEK